jgi:hypothetical protein
MSEGVHMLLGPSIAEVLEVAHLCICHLSLSEVYALDDIFGGLDSGDGSEGNEITYLGKSVHVVGFHVLVV